MTLSVARLSPKMRQALAALAENGRHPLHPRTQRALCGEGLIEPVSFVPRFPVPLPDEWRLTRAGRRALAALTKEK